MKSRLLPGLLLALAASVAMAATLTFTWTNPTQNTDNTAIPSTGAGSLTNTIIEYGPCNAAKDALASVTGTLTTANGTITTALTPNTIGPGTWCGRAKVTNTFGEVSDWSNVASKVIDAPKPKPPTNFSFGS